MQSEVTMIASDGDMIASDWEMFVSDCTAYLYYYVMPQITEKLLEAEEKKLRVLKAEIEAGKHTKDAAKVIK